MLSYSVVYKFLWPYVLSLKLQYFGHLACRDDLLEETLILGEIEGRRRRGQVGWMASLTQCTSLSKLQGMVEGQGCLVCCSLWGCKESDMTEQQQQQWTIARQAPLSMWILQARILQWVSIPSTSGSSNPGIEPRYPTLLVNLSHPGNPRILELVAYSFSKGTSLPRNQTGISCIEGEFFTSWATQEANIRNSSDKIEGTHNYVS